jgi:primosomal protein N' (replication factor Y)
MAKLHGQTSLICRVAVPVPLYRTFDYLAPEGASVEQLKLGIRLAVPFGKNQKTGVLIECVTESGIDRAKLKLITQIIDSEPLLSKLDLALLHWASWYYHHPLGEVIGSAFPAALRQGKAAILDAITHYALTEQGQQTDVSLIKRSAKQAQLLSIFQQQAGHVLSEDELALWDKTWRSVVKPLLVKQLIELSQQPVAEKSLLNQAELVCNVHQQAAIDQVCNELGRFSVFLLEGVTGSGKTEVYMQIIRAVLERGQQILLLLPEITLTPQLEERFRKRFAVPISISHSKLTDNQRQAAWLQIQSGQSSILLGTRSALFTPLKNPGLIILDEEHDSSFKQQEGFRFSARDVAIVRAKMLNIPIVLGSATPALETLHNAAKQRYQLLQLPNRAGSSVAPALHLLDIRNKKLTEGLSEILITEIHKTLAKNEQVLLFLNRRGFAPTLICHSCGWVARCGHCDANLVIHHEENRLRCHHCAQEQVLMQQCPACNAKQLLPLGLGTERVEKVLAELFVGKTIVRLDRDSTKRKGSLENYLDQINQGQVDIILGTQMLAKGHHFVGVTLVAIVDVDSGLFSIDFHAAEKMAQMIVQVAGRAGRAEKPGRVIMQTRHPDHPLLTTLISQGYNSFAQIALNERQEAMLPPFSYQALLRAQTKDPQLALQFLRDVSQLALQHNSGNSLVLGPVAAPMAKRAGLYRYQLLLQNDNRQALHGLLDNLIPNIASLKLAAKVRWSVDVDPVDLF